MPKPKGKPLARGWRKDPAGGLLHYFMGGRALCGKFKVPPNLEMSKTASEDGEVCTICTVRLHSVLRMEAE